MHLKKLLSASVALCMTASQLLGAGVFSASAKDEKLTFDIRSGGKNTVTVSSKELETGAYTVPVSVYIPENPGICAMNLKFQVNDGQIDKNNAFQNYGFKLKGGSFAEPNVFAVKEGEEPMAYFSDTNMNLTWVYALDGNTNGVAAAEANTTTWAKSVSWAYDNAFLVTELVVPANTPAGEYSFTIRTEPFVNAMSVGSEKQQMSRSKCKGANVNEALEFTVIPLTVKVEEPVVTTTTVETTSAAPVTTTVETTSSSKPVTTTVETTSSGKPVTTTIETTSSAPIVTTTVETTSSSKPMTTTIETTSSAPIVTTTIETTSSSKPMTTTIETTSSAPIVTTTIETTSSSKPMTTTIETTSGAPITTTIASLAPGGELWQDGYKLELEGVSHYLIMGDVQAKPGETVSVPVYVYGDTGTAGMNLKFTYDKKMTLEKFQFSKASERAYVLSSETGPELYPASFSAISSNGSNLIAQDGKIVLNLVFNIPADAADGTVYTVGFEKTSVDVCDTDGTQLDVSVFDGSVTVVTDGKTTLNKKKVTFSKAGETANLTLFNAKGEVKWSIDNEGVATVDQNGFVVAKGKGSAVITAENNGSKYTANVIVGLFGDANLNGEVNMEDAKLVLDEHVIVNLTNGESIITDAGARYNADVNGDGKITDKDAKKILDYVVQSSINLNPSWYELTGNPNAPDAPAQ